MATYSTSSLPTGTDTITASYRGATAFGPSRASVIVAISPSTVSVQTPTIISVGGFAHPGSRWTAGHVHSEGQRHVTESALFQMGEWSPSAIRPAWSAAHALRRRGDVRDIEPPVWHLHVYGVVRWHNAVRSSSTGTSGSATLTINPRRRPAANAARRRSSKNAQPGDVRTYRHTDRDCDQPRPWRRDAHGRCRILRSMARSSRVLNLFVAER